MSHYDPPPAGIHHMGRGCSCLCSSLCAAYTNLLIPHHRRHAWAAAADLLGRRSCCWAPSCGCNSCHDKLPAGAQMHTPWLQPLLQLRCPCSLPASQAHPCRVHIASAAAAAGAAAVAAAAAEPLYPQAPGRSPPPTSHLLQLHPGCRLPAMPAAGSGWQFPRCCCCCCLRAAVPVLRRRCCWPAARSG
jgi:hypothetical protein